MQRNPLISVVMSVHNAQNYLKEAVESILNQTFHDFEFIIIDDKSTDESPKILSSYTDTRIVIFQNNENIGLTRSLNKGILSTRGKYIARMDADDISVAARLSIQYDFLEKNPKVAACGSWVKLIGDNPSSVWKSPCGHNQIRATLLFNSALFHPTVMMRRAMIGSTPYNDDFYCSQDFDLWVRLSNRYHIQNISRVLLHYRIHDMMIGRTHSQNQILNTMKTIRNQIDHLGIKPTELELKLHQSITFSDYHYLRRHFSSLVSWLIKVIRANNICYYVNSFSLIITITGRMLRLIFHSCTSLFERRNANNLCP
jgi:glycosyltransferase involved in cell wall biosynthesis